MTASNPVFTSFTEHGPLAQLVAMGGPVMIVIALIGVVTFIYLLVFFIVAGQLTEQPLPGPDAHQPLKIAADQSLTMADLESLLRLLKEGGYTDVLLLTEPGA